MSVVSGFSCGCVQVCLWAHMYLCVCVWGGVCVYQTRSCVVCSEQVSKSHDVGMQGEGSKKRTEASTVALVHLVCLVSP